MVGFTEEAVMAESRRAGKATTRTASAAYTTKIIKAGALLSDTKALLGRWDTSLSVRENLDRFRYENLLGKSSRSRIEDILKIFRQRYLDEQSVTRALVKLVRNGFPASSLDRILYFHAARADCLLRDLVTEALSREKRAGTVDIDVGHVERTLTQWISDEKTTTQWSPPTARRVAQGLLSTLRDFGVLEGAVKKRITALYLPVEAFAYVAFYLKQLEPSGMRLLDHPDWRLFFLTRDGVERFLIEAHQRDLLEYHAAGTVTRLTFPADTLEAFAHVLIERTH
jgi:hypothetical protein